MDQMFPNAWPQFFTATIFQWKPLLENDKYKNVIIESLQFLVNNKRINLIAFVIMNTHIHIIWQACAGHTLQKAQQSFMKFTAQVIKFDLLKTNPALLQEYKVNAADREYRFWKRRSLGIELFTPAVLQQKINYIHYNPVKATLCKLTEEYYFSSAKFYHWEFDDFSMLSHYL